MGIDAVVGVGIGLVGPLGVPAPGLTPGTRVVTVMSRRNLEGVPLTGRALAVINAAMVGAGVVVEPPLLKIDLSVVGREGKEVRSRLGLADEARDHADHEEETAEVVHGRPREKL